MEIYPHSLLYPPIRQIAPDQKLAINSVLCEFGNLLRNPILPPFDKDSYTFRLLENLHGIIDAVEGTHVRTGRSNCEACSVIAATGMLSLFMTVKYPALYKRIRNGEQHSILYICKKYKIELERFTYSTFPNATETARKTIDDINNVVEFLTRMNEALIVKTAPATPPPPNTVPAPAAAPAALAGGESDKPKIVPSTTQAQRAAWFDVDVKTIRNWDKKKPSAAPPGYNANFDKATLEGIGKLYRAERASRMQANLLNRFDARDNTRRDDPPEFKNELYRAVWNEK